MIQVSEMTQNEKIVRSLFTLGEELTASVAKARYGIENLSARINELRKASIHVVTRMKPNKQGRMVAFYSMPQAPVR